MGRYWRAELSLNRSWGRSVSALASLGQITIAFIGLGCIYPNVLAITFFIAVSV